MDAPAFPGQQGGILRPQQSAPLRPFLKQSTFCPILGRCDLRMQAAFELFHRHEGHREGRHLVKVAHECWNSGGNCHSLLVHLVCFKQYRDSQAENMARGSSREKRCLEGGGGGGGGLVSSRTVGWVRASLTVSLALLHWPRGGQTWMPCCANLLACESRSQDQHPTTQGSGWIEKVPGASFTFQSRWCPRWGSLRQAPPNRAGLSGQACVRFFWPLRHQPGGRQAALWGCCCQSVHLHRSGSVSPCKDWGAKHKTSKDKSQRAASICSFCSQNPNHMHSLLLDFSAQGQKRRRERCCFK